MGRKPKNETPAAAPALDLTALDHATAVLPERSRITTSTKWDNNPFVQHVRASRDDSTGRSVTVAAYHAREVVSGIRDAADKVTEWDAPIGVRIICEWTGDDGTALRTAKVADLPNDERPVVVLYGAKARRRSFTSDDERKEAIAMGFVSAAGKPAARPYFDWVEDGRPMEDNSTE